MKKSLLKGYAFAVMSAVIYGCMPLMAKYIYADGVNSVTLVFLRNLLALPVLAALAYREKGSLKIPPRSLGSITLISFLGCALTPLLLFSAYRYIASGTATVFHYIYPAAVVVAGILFLKRPVKAVGIVSVLLCVAGVALFYDPKQAFHLGGSVLALASGITFAGYVVLLSVFRYREVSGFLLGFYVAAASAVMMLGFCLCSGALALPGSLWGWGLCLLFAIGITAGAVYFFQQATFLLGGEKTAILSTLEPITSVIVGVAVFHEAVGVNTLIGAVLVIAASILIAAADAKKAPEMTEKERS